jgi:hypothetical protein
MLYFQIDFVDCGAYTGDTAEQVIRRNPAFSRIIAIEAVPQNFARLRNVDWHAR